ncbi:hypothetical protein KBD45_03215 [Candidatus Dojkabacteria bacterium]|nr:hypothetical protein [Candidatus Dojkabacteria bacterium]
MKNLIGIGIILLILGIIGFGVYQFYNNTSSSSSTFENVDDNIENPDQVKILH